MLILQFFWLWIDDFVGKGVDGPIFINLIIYLCATLVPLALPLAVLLSSIMTFGNLGETFELVAIKSAGIGLASVHAAAVDHRHSAVGARLSVQQQCDPGCEP